MTRKQRLSTAQMLEELAEGSDKMGHYHLERDRPNTARVNFDEASFNRELARKLRAGERV